MGDADCGKSVNARDALLVLRFVARLTGYGGCMAAADVNCDGRVDARDALLILRYAAKLPFTPAPGCPAIGVVMPS